MLALFNEMKEQGACSDTEIINVSYFRAVVPEYIRLLLTFRR